MPNGTQTTYSYDPASQVTQILHQLTATSTQTNKADYLYNGVGNRTSLTDRRGSQAFGYDALDRLTSASHPLLGTTQAFAYDPVGNRTTGGSVVNAGNQLTADANFAYQYDDNGNLTRKTLLATGNFTVYTYDAENRLINVEEFAAGNPTPTVTSTYRYDGLGRRIEKVANGQTKRYVYDGEDILLEYNGSNVLQATYTHGPGIDEPLSRTPMAPGLGSGRIAVLASTPDGLRGPVVDDTIVVNGQISLGFLSGSSFLPPVGQPIDATGSHLPVAPLDVTAAANSGTLTISLVDTATLSGNAPLYLVLREQATGRVVESQLLFPARLTAPSTAQPGLPTVIASTTVPISTPVANGTLFYHQDGLGSVTELTDSTGSVAKAYAYDAYGNMLDSPGTVEQPYTYTGREFDSESGLFYFRTRYYDPRIGRFLRKDPIGLIAGVNVYAYVGNNPSNRLDPWGLFPMTDCVKGILAPYFPGVNLDLIDIREGLPFYADNNVVAITRENNIYFAPGRYDPYSRAGIALIGHETAHVGQYAEYGDLGFVLKYGSEYLAGRLRGMSEKEAYENISFEWKARAKERQISDDLKEKYGNEDPCPEPEACHVDYE